MASEFVRRRLKLNAIAAGGGSRPERIYFASFSEDDVLDQRSYLAKKCAPTKRYKELAANIGARQAIGDDEVPPVATNDNQPKIKPEPKVRKSTGKSVRGSFADTLPMVLAFRNTPDHLPEPITSNWSVDPTSTIPEPDVDEVKKPLAGLAEDMLLEITPSINKIRAAFEKGEVVRGKPQRNKKTGKVASQGPVISIGRLRFSDGSQTEKAVRVREGKAEEYEHTMPIGAMLRTEEKLSPHIGTDPRATLSNRRLTGMIFGLDEKENPINWRPFTPRGKQRRGRSYTPAQSRALIEKAIANTKAMPPVTKCPPGVASGAARFSDQFVGVVTASTGKGGALHWVDVFTAMRDREEWQATLGDLDPKTVAILDAAMTAKTLGEVGVAAGQSEKYATFNGGGKRAAVAANDNLAAAIKKRAA